MRIDEQQLMKRQRATFLVMILLGVFVFGMFFISLKQSLPVDTSTETTTPPSSTESQPSRFEGLNTMFGDGSLANKLLLIDFNSLTVAEKEELDALCTSLGGTVHFTNECITLTHNGRSMKIFSNGTYLVTDPEGGQSGNVWIETELSMGLPQLENKLLLCMADEGSFAARYQVTEQKVYNDYCKQLQDLGYTADLFTSEMMFFAKNSEGVAASVSLNEGVLTLLIEHNLEQPEGEN